MRVAQFSNLVTARQVAIGETTHDWPGLDVTLCN